jgi:hypothetical protein
LACLCICLFIFSLFNNRCSWWHYIKLNGRMISEWLIKKDVEGSGHGLI